MQRLARALPAFQLGLLWLVFQASFAGWTLAQDNAGAQQLQTRGIAKMDHWTGYARRTGDAKSTVSELASARSDLQSSYDLFLKQQDFGGAAASAIRIADIERMLNQQRDAGATYRNAVELAKRSKRIDYQTKALARLAFSELEIDETDAAHDHAREAVRLGPDCGNKTFYFEALDVAAEVEIKLGNLVAAGEFLDRALAMSAGIDDKQQLYLAYGDRADLYGELARKCDYQRDFDVCYRSLELARADYQKAVSLTQELGYDYLTRTFRTLLDGLDARKALVQSMQRGNQSVNEATIFHPRKPSDVLVTESFAAMGASPRDLATVEGLVKQLREWRASLQQQGLIIEELDPRDFYMQGQLAQMRGDREAALAAFLRAVDLLEQDRRKLRNEQARGQFLEDKTDYYYLPALLLLDQKRYSEAFALFERSRSRSMADMLASRPLNLGTSRERTLYAQLQALRVNIAAQQEKLFNLTGSPDRDQHVSEIMRLQNRIAGLEREDHDVETRIRLEAPKLQELVSAQPVTLDSVRQSARKGGYDVLYYVVLESGLVLWHINGDGVQVKNVFLPHAQLASKTEALRRLLVARRDSPDASFDVEGVRQLYLYLIQPVLSSIATRHLVVVPHEELHSLPFQVLQNPQSGKFLGEDFGISYAASATVLSALGTKRNLGGSRLLAVADPGIHEAGEEVEAIGRLYPGRSKLATQTLTGKSDLKAWIKDYNVVHLSVHGRFDAADPLLSYLQLKEVPPDNGRLTAADMFGLPLQKGSLVVLSACETARAEATHANEVLGLVRSLLYAGADTLVLSSWEVDAASTRLWMETFYREAQDKPLVEAARLASIAVKSRPEYSHPFFWAPFVVIGK